MDFDKGLFTLEVDGKTAIKPSELRSAVKKYKIAGIVVEDMVGEVRMDGDTVLLKTKSNGLEFEIIKAKDAKAFDDLSAKLGEGKTAFKVSGALSDEKQKKDGKDVVVLKLALGSFAVVEQDGK